MKKILFLIFKVIIIIIPHLISVAYFTIAERKIMGGIQMRRGPNVVGFIGLLQPLADGLKLFLKEIIFPNSSDEIFFLIAPLMALILSILGWGIIPFSDGIFLTDLNLGVIYIFCVSACNIYSLLFAGWGSNSKYSFIGAIRSTAQMISYELAFSFSCLIIVLSSNSFNFSKIILIQKYVWFIIPFFSIFIIFYICILAETNRHPFDLPEAESELVSGYNVEYSGIPFAQFFLGEYGNMLLMSVFGAIFFIGGWFILKSVFGPFLLGFKICIGVFYFIINRAIFPRFRFDQLMELGWKSLLPLVIGYFFYTIGLSLLFNGFYN